MKALQEIVYRVFQNPKSTLTAIGLLGAIMVALSANYPKVQWIGVAATVISIIYKTLATDTNVRPMLFIGILLMGSVGILQGQGTGAAPTPAGGPVPVTLGVFGLSGEAIGVSIGNQWGVGADSIETMPVTNTFSVEGHQIIVQQIDYSGYYGGLIWQPDMRGIISKTKLPPNTFQPFFHAAGGIARNGLSENHPSGFAGGGIKFSPNQDGAFSVVPIRVDYLNAAGFGASPHGVLISAGMSYVFGK